MKKVLVRVALAAVAIGVVLIVRQAVTDLSESEKLWKSITDQVDDDIEE